MNKNLQYIFLKNTMEYPQITLEWRKRKLPIIPIIPTNLSVIKKTNKSLYDLLTK